MMNRVLTCVQIGDSEISDFSWLCYIPRIGSIHFYTLKDFRVPNCSCFCLVVENNLETVSNPTLAHFYLCPLMKLWDRIVIMKIFMLMFTFFVFV